MAKILITGATGFVGKNLVSYLLNEHMEVQPVNRTELQCLDLSLFNNIDVVVHLAGKAHDLKKSSHSDKYYQINFELTKNLYNIFLDSGAKKFIFISSVKAVADSFDGILTEEIVARPQTHYGKSKLMAEEYIQQQELPQDKSYFILRPSMIHGPGNKGNLNLLYRFIKRGIPYPLAAFDNKRSFLSIENLCFIIKKLICDNKSSSGIYQVSDDEPLSTNEVVNILAESINMKPKLWYLPTKVIIAIAKIGDKLRLPLNTERLQKLTESYVVSNYKIRSALNIHLPIESKKGLRATAESFKF